MSYDAAQIEMIQGRLSKYDELFVSLQIAQAKTSTVLEELMKQNAHRDARQDAFEHTQADVARTLAILTQKQSDDVTALNKSRESDMRLIDEKTASTLRYAALILSLAFIVVGLLTGVLSSIIQHALFH